MIQSFGDSETEKIYHQLRSKKLPYEIQKRALVKLLLIDAAESEEDLKVPPGNRFEHLSGRLQGYCSIKINYQWRILFKFMNSNASEVTITDYH